MQLLECLQIYLGLQTAGLDGGVGERSHTVLGDRKHSVSKFIVFQFVYEGKWGSVVDFLDWWHAATIPVEIVYLLNRCQILFLRGEWGGGGGGGWRGWEWATEREKKIIEQMVLIDKLQTGLKLAETFNNGILFSAQ